MKKYRAATSLALVGTLLIPMATDCSGKPSTKVVWTVTAKQYQPVTGCEYIHCKPVPGKKKKPCWAVFVKHNKKTKKVCTTEQNYNSYHIGDKWRG